MNIQVLLLATCLTLALVTRAHGMKEKTKEIEKKKSKGEVTEESIMDDMGYSKDMTAIADMAEMEMDNALTKKDKMASKMATKMAKKVK